MRHRRSFELLAFVALTAAALGLPACSSASSSGSGGSGGESGAGGTSAGPGGGTSAAGSAGTAGAGGTAGGAAGSGAGGSNAGGTAGSGTGGTGGTGADPCMGIDANGVCAMDKKSLRYCRVPPVGSKDPPVLVTVDCKGAEVCTVGSNGVADCQVPAGQCQPGTSQCADPTTLQTCRPDGSGYDSTPCGAGTKCLGNPQTGLATCEAVSGAATGGGDTLHGCVQFEHRGYSAGDNPMLSPTPSVFPAWLQFIAVYNNDNGQQTYVGSAITGPDGCFDAPLSEPAKSDTIVYLYTLDFAPGSNTPLVAVVKNDDPHIDTQTSSDYWFWSNQGDPCGLQPAAVTPDMSGAGKHTMDMLTIPEACGSGAINIFQWVRYGMYRMGDANYGLQSTRSIPQRSIAVFWSPGVDSDCGACFVSGAGATVNPQGATQPDYYDTLMQISGSMESPTQWSYSVMSHETGHYVMFNYSRSPGEGGQHFVAQASKPGLAYSEGWATAFGIWNQSTDTYDVNTKSYGPADMNTDYDARYIDQQQGTVFWVQVDQATWSMGALQTPDPNGGIGQYLNENIVSDMIWHFWQPADAGKMTNDTAYQGVNPDGVMQVLMSNRILKGQPRGYMRVNLVDFFDAAACSSMMGQVDASAGVVGFPYDNQPTCQ